MNASKPYRILLILLFIFAMPSVAAFWVYMHPDKVALSKTNKGQLLQPPKTLAAFKATKPHWRLAYWNAQGCDESCAKYMDKLARVRLALGRRLYQVDNYLLISKTAQPLSNEVQQQLKDQGSQILAIDDAQAVLETSSKIYIVSPDNRLILSYQPDVEADDVFQDINHLVHK